MLTTTPDPTPVVKPKPFLKWVGGKRQLLPALMAGLPEKFGAYHEPFLGGGALFFELFWGGFLKRGAFLSDLNIDLVEAFGAVKDTPFSLMGALRKHQYNEEYFYRLRAQKPRKMFTRAARLIFLNKTCFNGLHRVNARGDFNVPFGKYESPTIFDRGNILACSKALSDVAIGCRGFDSVLRWAKAGDLVYFDPPYYPISKTANFAQYERSGFGSAEHVRLRDVFVELDARGCFVMLSNSYCPFTLKLFRGLQLKNGKARVQCVHANRAVNSVGSLRGPVKEILVRNF